MRILPSPGQKPRTRGARAATEIRVIRNIPRLPPRLFLLPRSPNLGPPSLAKKGAAPSPKPQAAIPARAGNCWGPRPSDLQKRRVRAMTIRGKKRTPFRRSLGFPVLVMLLTVGSSGPLVAAV